MRCFCGRAARILASGKGGMGHNVGRTFGVCAKPQSDPTRCSKWAWTNGTRNGAKPFGDESQARFNDWMDGYLGCCN